MEITLFQLLQVLDLQQKIRIYIYSPEGYKKLYEGDNSLDKNIKLLNCKVQIVVFSEGNVDIYLGF